MKEAEGSILIFTQMS